MKIELFEHERYIVTNDTGDKYMVDITDNKDVYSCQCPDFIYVKKKAVDEGKRLYTPATCCKHITAVLTAIDDLKV